MIEFKPMYPFNMIVLNLSLVRAVGYHSAAVLSAIADDLHYHPEKAKDIYMRISVIYILNYTGLSSDELVEAIDKLKAEGIITLNPDNPVDDDGNFQISLNEEAFEI